MLPTEEARAPQPARLTRPVVLIGFMGAGKTKVGKIAAQYIGCDFVDTDHIVERSAGKTIPQLFAEIGEERFRHLETEAIEHALNTHGGIIALGGGAATREENWQLLRRSGAMTIYLQASPRTILARVADKGTRPLLAGLDRQQMLEKITSLLEQREPWYLRADITLPTDNSLDKYGMADSLVARLKEAGISAAESHRTS
ncbi:MAG TPA: shikimate kinase [Candidatus Latescibacteria bacterium]|nr:shikimate kinase [Candidatus Latescibacterota bacterium]